MEITCKNNYKKKVTSKPPYSHPILFKRVPVMQAVLTLFNRGGGNHIEAKMFLASSSIMSSSQSSIGLQTVNAMFDTPKSRYIT